MTTIATTPLPALNDPQIRKLGWTAESDHYKAYVVVLEAEAHVVQCVAESEALPGTKKDRDSAKKVAEGKLVSVRVAGQLFLEFERLSGLFGVEPTDTLVKWFLSRPQSAHDNRHDVVVENGTLLCDNFIRAFRTSNLPHEEPSSHSSCASFDTLADMIKDSTDTTSRNYGTSRKKVLARDGYRCAVTGVYDETSLKRCRQLKGITDVAVGTLQVAHIFNESTAQGVDSTASRDGGDSKTYGETDHASNALAILESLGFSNLAKTFEASEGVHKVWNLLTLQSDVHSFFDHFNMWFEHTDKPNRYEVCTARGYHKVSIIRFEGQRRPVSAPFFVEFNSGIKDVPPPHPILLAFHAACARVTHMSGAAEYFDQVERDLEETRVLSFDGSSSRLLGHLLSGFASPIPRAA